MKIIIALLLLTGSIYAQNNWQVVKQATLGEVAETGFFIDENTGWLGGDKGVIYATDNGGAVWTVQRDTSSDQGDIHNIYFLDANTGWACGDDATVLYTTNGGTTWAPSGNVSTTEDLYGINFIDASIGYACGDGGVIIKTTDGGLHWLLLTTPTTQKIYDIEFFDANNGIAIIKKNLSSTLWTNSGGFLWSTASFTPGQSNSTMHDCDVVRGTSHAWIIGYHGNVHHSMDKGQNWSLCTAFYGTSNAYAAAIDFADANTGYAGGADGEFYRTSDCGAHWDTVSTGTGNRIKKVFSLDANNIVVIGTGHQIRKSNDGGDSWTPLIDWPRETFRAIGVADSLNITCCTFGGDLTHSNNAGTNFSFPGNENLPTTGAIFCVDFYDANLGFYGAAGGEIAKSVDGGETWYKTNVTGANELRRIQSFFIYNQDIAWAGAGKGAGIHGRVYKTIDGGENWNEVAALDEIIYGLYFLNDQIGYAVGEYGKIYKCTDGNTSWTMIDSVGEKDLTAIDFIDSQTGYVVSYNGILGKTTDGGNTWDIVDTLGYMGGDISDTYELWDIHFVDSNEGWIASGDIWGNNGAFYHTTDGGDNWEKIDSPDGKTVREIEFVTPTYGWAAGMNGTIFGYGVTVGIEDDLKHKLPRSMELYQNYPNPFNPITTIEYQLNISGLVELTIFDIQGRSVRSLVKSNQKPGLYRFSWDGKNSNGLLVSSGLYLYQLKIDNAVHAKRMILIK